MIGAALLLLASSAQDATPTLDPRRLPRAELSRWKDFDPAKLDRASLPPGMESVQRALLAADYPTALSALHAVLEKTPDFPPAWHQLGVLYFRLQRYGDAVVCLERYLELAPQRVGDTRVLAHGYYSLGDYPRAKAHYERVLEKNPGEVEALRGHALACMRLGESERALAELEKVLELDPSHEDAATWRASLLYELERLEEARSAALAARDLDPFQPKPWYLLARILGDLGQEAPAREAQRRFEELAAIAQELRAVENRLMYRPVDLGLLKTACALHRQAGNRVKLRESLARLFRADPESVDLRLFGLELTMGLADEPAGRLLAEKLAQMAPEELRVWERLEKFYASIKDRKREIEAGERRLRLSGR
jgi:tetratricopeptide (TPR) repeat protein